MLIDAPVSPPKLAKLLGVKADTVRGWIDRGELPAVNLADPNASRPRWRILPDGLKQFLDARSNKPQTEPSRRRRKRRRDLKMDFMR